MIPYTDKISEVIESFSEEERRIFSKIQEKIMSCLEEEQDIKTKSLETMTDAISEDNPTIDFSDRHPEILHPKNITKAPHEIIFYIKAEVSEIDHNGRLKDIKDLVERYYHIPVKIKEDYNLFMNKFFEQFQETLEKTCRETITK